VLSGIPSAKIYLYPNLPLEGKGARHDSAEIHRFTETSKVEAVTRVTVRAHLLAAVAVRLGVSTHVTAIVQAGRLVSVSM